MSTAQPAAALVDAALAERTAAMTRELIYTMADALPNCDETFDDELIEGTLGRGTMAVLYGDSNSGKTFAAIDMAAAICLGDPWLGRQTSPGMVLYLATEGVESVKLRLRAYQRHHGVRVPGLVIVASPVNLFDGRADANAVIALVHELQAEHGNKAVLVIGDTLARISAGANENSGEDMGVVLRNADAIREVTGCTFLWIHHSGKDAAKGARGWSGTRAAIDTEIEVVADSATGNRSLEITKQRDLPGKGDRIGFRLEPVTLGVNQWGTPRGSCVVLPAEAPAKAARGKRPSEVAGAITELLNGKTPSGMKKSDIVKHFEERYDRGTVYRELKKMLASGRLHEVAGTCALRAAFTTEAQS